MRWCIGDCACNASPLLLVSFCRHKAKTELARPWFPRPSLPITLLGSSHLITWLLKGKPRRVTSSPVRVNHSN